MGGMSKILGLMVASGFAAFACAGAKSAGVPGRLLGKPFTPDVFSIKALDGNSVKVDGRVVDTAKTWILSLQVGDDFIPDRQIQVWISLDSTKSLNGYSVAWKPTKFGTQAHTDQLYGAANRTAAVGRGITTVFLNDFKKHTSHSELIDCKLAFGVLKRGKIPFKIDLRLPDGTSVKGAYFATASD